MLKTNVESSVQAALLDDLEHYFSPISIRDIGVVAEAVENMLSNTISTIIVENISVFIPGAKSNISSSGNLFDLDDKRYRIAVAPVLIKPDELEMALLEHTLEARKQTRKSKHKTIQITGFGIYTRIKFSYPEDFMIDVDLILSISKTIIETGYRWIFNQITAAVGDKSICCEGLYGILRTVTGDENVINQTWFVTMRKNYGFFLLDREVIRSSLARINKLAANIDKSAFDLITQMILHFLPFELMHSKVAVSNGKCIDIDLMDSKYAKDNPDLVESEIAIFGDRMISVCPLIYDKEPFLLLGFPSGIKPEIEIILTEHKERIVRHFERFYNRINKLSLILKMKDSSFIDIAEAGKFFGGLIAGAIETVSKQ